MQEVCYIRLDTIGTQTYFCVNNNNTMITNVQFTDMAMSFPGTVQKPHFERTGFAVTGKRMFATYFAKNNTTNIFLTLKEQKLFCDMDSKHIYPIP